MKAKDITKVLTGGKVSAKPAGNVSKVAGPLGSMPKTTARSGIAPAMPGSRRSTPTPKPTMVQPKPAIRSTAKPAMPGRKK